MYALSRKWYTDNVQSTDAQDVHDSVITKNNSFIEERYAHDNNLYASRWRSENELQRHYWTTSLLLPVGSIFMLCVTILLLVLFRKCPYIVTAIAAAILATVIIFTTLMSINHTEIYF